MSENEKLEMANFQVWKRKNIERMNQVMGFKSELLTSLLELELMIPISKLNLQQFESKVKKYAIQGTEIVTRNALTLSFG